MSNGPNATPPDFGKAYSGFIKAVEAAAYGMIEPNNSKATLGTMLGHMRSYPNHFCPLLPAPGIAPSAVIGMMTALWEGQTSRHGGQQPTRPETSQEAYAAAHLAVVLVQWFRSGTVRRTREGQNGGSSEKPAPTSASDAHRSGAAPGTPAYTSCFSWYLIPSSRLRIL